MEIGDHSVKECLGIIDIQSEEFRVDVQMSCSVTGYGK